MWQLPHVQHVALQERKHVLAGQRQLLSAEEKRKRQAKDCRKRQRPPPLAPLHEYMQPCQCGDNVVVVTERGYCARCYWLAGVVDLPQAVANIAHRQGHPIGPRHERKPAYYQWRHGEKKRHPETLSKVEWDALQQTDCEGCGARSWHAQWNCPVWKGQWHNLCKCCALLIEPFDTLSALLQHVQCLVV